MGLKLGEIFKDGMVLQRDKEINVWGTAESGSTINVSLKGKNYSVETDVKGEWKVCIPALSASFGTEMIVSDGVDKICIEDVLIGDVFVAGGQSNMEFFMRYDKDFDKVVQTCENPLIRFYDIPEISTSEEPQMHDYSLFGFWRKATPEDLQYFSAVGYYFARTMQEHLQVPIGIVGCNWGGTRSCCWMDEESVEKYGPVWMRDYEEQVASITDMEEAKQKYLTNMISDKSHPFDNPIDDKMMYGNVSKEELEGMMDAFAELDSISVLGPWHPWRPCGCYHYMLNQIASYTVKGVIWYQGESDSAHPEIYADMMEGLIKCWRRDWNDELPFFMTQLAPFGTEIMQDALYYPELRQQQELVTKRVNNVFLASIGDVGNYMDIHPKEKQPVGHRLALLALGHLYNEKILCDAPMSNFSETKDGQIIIHFSNASGGLFLKGDTINAISLIDETNKDIDAVNYSTTIEDESLIITVNNDEVVKAVSFAETPYYEVNLYNMSKIPVMPFRVEL
ncbi:MAG: sialate O-acetylesterase [Pseudobutyrivibrio ruminis]|uniref:sialate O-acetylesterase n=1 Tax=Pseudobutyrivibrio ruminis TaxID=46206 RepID=UPI0026F32115|nr:sialate O-acetylesterase [Pseudobutyrivibrio ruminis]MBE5912636.1 sialate O-acetylesterase [Pseudobutyrivibrio ruminis]